MFKETPAILKQEGKVVAKSLRDSNYGKKGCQFINQTKQQLLKSKGSYEKLIQEHEVKLMAYIDNPDKYDHLGLLKNISSEIKQKRIQGRINELQRQIFRQKRDLDIINDLLISKGL